MKRELTLSQSPGPLYLLAVIDIIVLIVALSLFYAGTPERAGVRIELPPTEFHLPRNDQFSTLYVTGVLEQSYFFDNKYLKQEELNQAIEKAKKNPYLKGITLAVDRNLPSELLRQLSDLILSHNLECYLLGGEEQEK